MSYEWFSIDNKIDDLDDAYDFFVSTVGSTYESSLYNWKLSVMPDRGGRKTTFVTTQTLGM